MVETVTQVRLMSKRNGSTTETVCWIDSDSAYLGRKLRIEDDSDDRVYEVVFVGDTIDHAAMKKQEAYYRTHRRGTDI